MVIFDSEYKFGRTSTGAFHEEWAKDTFDNAVDAEYFKELGWGEDAIAKIDFYDLNMWLEAYGITSQEQICHFLSQASVECAEGKSYIEYYKELGEAPRDPEVVKGFNNYYLGVNGNRKDSPNDGSNFRGAGMLQLTGRENYARFANRHHEKKTGKKWEVAIYQSKTAAEADEEDRASGDPDRQIMVESGGKLPFEQIAEKKYRVESACYYWTLGSFAYEKAEENILNITQKVKAITNVVKGNDDLWERRLNYYEKIKKYLDNRLLENARLTQKTKT